MPQLTYRGNLGNDSAFSGPGINYENYAFLSPSYSILKCHFPTNEALNYCDTINDILKPNIKDNLSFSGKNKSYRINRYYPKHGDTYQTEISINGKSKEIYKSQK